MEIKRQPPSFDDLSVSDQVAVAILRKRSGASNLEFLGAVTHLTVAGFSPQDIARWAGRSFDWACRFIVLGELDIAVLNLVRKEWSLPQRDITKGRRGKRALFPLSTAIEAAKLPPHEQLSFVQAYIRKNAVRPTATSGLAEKGQNVPLRFCVKMKNAADLDDWLHSCESMSPDDLAAILEMCSPDQRQSLVARARNIVDQLAHSASTAPYGASLGDCNRAIRVWFGKRQYEWWQSRLSLEEWMNQNKAIFGANDPESE